jgi:hypothetical protein
VDDSRVDRRIHAGNWCNQSGAGIGARPQAAPASGFDAYVWIKPPGESDGSSREIDNDEGKRFDRMCDPTYTRRSPADGSPPSSESSSRTPTRRSPDPDHRARAAAWALSRPVSAARATRRRPAPRRRASGSAAARTARS